MVLYRFKYAEFNTIPLFIEPIGFRLKMALLCDFSVNLRDFLCGIHYVCLKRNPLISSGLPKIAYFQIEKSLV